MIGCSCLNYLATIKIAGKVLGAAALAMCAAAVLFVDIMFHDDTAGPEVLKVCPDVSQYLSHRNDDVLVLDFQSGESVCSRYVRLVYNKMMNPDGAKARMDYSIWDGVVGNAWHMPEHIRRMGGKVQPFTEHMRRGRGIYPGDIIGFYYPFSFYNGDAAGSHAGFTHVAIVLGVIQSRPVIAHFFPSPFLSSDRAERVDYLDRVFPLKPVVVLRSARVARHIAERTGEQI